MKYIAYCTKGTEPIVRAEILGKLKTVQIFEEEDKRIIFEYSGTAKMLLDLKCPDDIGILLDRFAFSDLKVFSERVLGLDLKPVLQKIYSIRQDIEARFSVTIGGVTSIDLNDLKKEIVNTLTNVTGFNYSETDHGNFDVRIFVDKNDIYLSVRLVKLPLYKREYKKYEKAGSLKPSIAACMVYAATQGKKNLRIVDNFCGSGTILCEALLMGNEVFGGDIDPQGVSYTRKNLQNLKFLTIGRSLFDWKSQSSQPKAGPPLAGKLKVEVKQIDAVKTNWPDNFFDCAVSNLPYGKQVRVSNITTLYRDALKEYVRIVKRGGVICLLGSRSEILRKYAKKYLWNPKIEEYKLGFLGQEPWLIMVENFSR
ncbi:MAG: methyltransferase domain-containing protein [Candidatus Dojkabacteria bacterium]|nr:methyltransferase domain-containing protein [Candidatus Dojkabacteria bacterium]